MMMVIMEMTVLGMVVAVCSSSNRIKRSGRCGSEKKNRRGGGGMKDDDGGIEGPRGKKKS